MTWRLGFQLQTSPSCRSKSGSQICSQMRAKCLVNSPNDWSNWQQTAEIYEQVSDLIKMACDKMFLGFPKEGMELKPGEVVLNGQQPTLDRVQILAETKAMERERYKQEATQKENDLCWGYGVLLQIMKLSLKDVSLQDHWVLKKKCNDSWWN